MMVTKRVFKNFSGLLRIKMFKLPGNNAAREALLKFVMFQNWTYTAFKINRSIQIQFSDFRYNIGSFLIRKNLGLFNLAQSVFLFFPIFVSRTSVYKRVTDLCKLEQKRLLSGYLSALTRSPRRRPSRDEILPTLSVASLFVERWGWRRGRRGRRRRRRIGRRNRPTSS